MEKRIEYWFEVLKEEGEIIMSQQEENNPSLFALDQLQNMGYMVPHEDPTIEGFQYVSDESLRHNVITAYRYTKGTNKLYEAVINGDHSLFSKGLVISVSLNVREQEKKIERLLKPVYESLKQAV